MKRIEVFLYHVKRFVTNPAEYRKGYVSLVAVAGYLVNNNVLHGSALRWVTLAIGAAAVLGVTAIKNAPSSTDTTISNPPAAAYVAPLVPGETGTPGTTTPPDVPTNVDTTGTAA